MKHSTKILECKFLFHAGNGLSHGQMLSSGRTCDNEVYNIALNTVNNKGHFFNWYWSDTNVESSGLNLRLLLSKIKLMKALIFEFLHAYLI